MPSTLQQKSEAEPQPPHSEQRIAATVPPKATPVTPPQKPVEPPQPVATPEPVPEPAPAPKPPPAPPTFAGSHTDWMAAAGIPASDWGAVDYIISHESGWRPTVTNAEGCVGLGQACPASKLYGPCPDLDPVCQLRFFTGYANSRYGSWQGAYQEWLGKHWW